MKNLRTILFVALFGIYIIGVVAGSIYQSNADNQEEMYDYLESAVSGYDAKISDSIGSIAQDNVKTLILLIPCAFFKIGIPGIVAVMLIKGYAAGFAITAVLRLYGVGGLMLSGANLISLAIIIPAMAYYGTAAIGNLICNRYEGKSFWKKAILLIIFMALMLAFDSALRGILSAVFTDLAAKVVKPV